MTKWIHISDLHLGRPFLSRREETREKLIQYQRDAFEKAVHTAVTERVNGVLITGDTFDKKEPAYADIQFAQRQINTLSAAGIPVFMLSGNHDPSPVYERLRLPEGSHVFKRSEPELVVVREEDGQPIAALAGCGYTEATDAVNRMRTYPAAHGKVPTIGLAHCMVAGIDWSKGMGDYQMCAEREIAAHRYAYWALGHIHIPVSLSLVNGGYAGSIMGLDPTDTGARGGWLIEIDEETTRRTFLPFGGERFISERVSIEADNVADLERQLVRLPVGQKVEDAYVRITVEGRSKLAKELERTEIVEPLAEQLKWEWNALDVEIRTEVLPAIDQDELASVSPYVKSLLDVARLPEARQAPLQSADGGGGLCQEDIEEALEALLDRMVKK